MGTPKRSGDSAVLPNAHSALIDPKVNEFNSFDQFKGTFYLSEGVTPVYVSVGLFFSAKNLCRVLLVLD